MDMVILLPRGYGYQCAIVAHIKQNIDGELIGLHNYNPIFDTRVYDNVFYSGKIVEVLENRVAEYILTSCEAEGN